jgi:hypothetical protein
MSGRQHSDIGGRSTEVRNFKRIFTVVLGIKTITVVAVVV